MTSVIFYAQQASQIHSGPPTPKRVTILLFPAFPLFFVISIQIINTKNYEYFIAQE